jgi:hypothetical protein
MGTLRRNRNGAPAEIKSAKLKMGEHISINKDRLMIMRMNDEKDVCLISTTHDDEMVPLRFEGKTRTSPKKSLIIIRDRTSVILG